ncbi:MAG: hypothetical protein KAY37_07335 [Phycisphaerae bacterium]|nr:hypothetical protein [Phycisphaerae bacterium]
MKRMTVTLWTILLILPLVRADDDVQRAMKDDVVLRALVDEIERSISDLELEDLERPYFIEYALQDAAGASVSAEFGAVTSKNESRARGLRTDVRVGSYELDNSNFEGDYGSYWGRFGGMMGGATMPIEDDYNAVRQAIWWTTDRDYKNVAEDLVKKKAFMESKMIEDKPDDHSREKPVVYLEDRLVPSLDLPELEELAVKLSAIFRDYPDIKDSGVSVSAVGGNKYLVNTEGTRIRMAGARYSISVNAEVQAEDGMELSDSFSVHVRDPNDLPARDELAQRCREMIEQLIAVKNAPVMAESYTGPVLFEAEAATAIFSQNFRSRFAGGQRAVGSRTSADDFANKLDRRILPRFLNVVDDPTRERLEGQPVMGHYKYDDEGVKARSVTLIEEGKLMALVMSRNPSKEFSNSTGHGRGVYAPSASIGCLIVTADPAAEADELRQELIEACQDEGLEYGIRIADLGSTGGGGYSSFHMRYGSSGGSGTNPLVMYKVYPDGREELVRGAEIARFDLKAFKRLLAAGDTLYVSNSGGRSHGTTVAAPAMLFEELDLAKIDRDFDKPPILETPLGRE